MNRKATIPPKGTGREKANVVASAARKAPAKIWTEQGGAVRLRITGKGVALTVYWDPEGRYDYDRSEAVIDGRKRKVRNAAEAMRLLQG